VQLVEAAGWNVKSPSDSMVTLPPSLVAKVPGVTVSGPGPSTSVSPARMSPVISVCGCVGADLLSSGSSTWSVVFPCAESFPLKVSSSATGASLTQVTVIDTEAVEPPFSVYVNVSGVVPGGSLQ
jgi:hypothetical protein